MDYETQRRLMCELGRRLWQRGWAAANDGNFSRRLGEGLFLVTPAGVSKGFLTTDMLLVVDSQGRPTAPSSYHPSSETALHLTCYRTRPDVGGVCHAHPPAATAFACARQGLDEPPLLGEAVMALGSVPCAPYGRTGTEALSRAAAPLLADHNAVLLANHGALTMGPDLEQAYWRMETLEHTAQICLNVRLLGGGVPLTPAEIAELAGPAGRTGGEGGMEGRG